MDYSVNKLAKMSGVSVRTLHYYDQVGLLKPSAIDVNGYRRYGEMELLKLQQILFFRELDFSLEEIEKIIDQPDFDVMQALYTHRTLLLKKIGRLKELIQTIDKTILKHKGVIDMKDSEYYGGFSKEKQEQYEQEIRERYGSSALDESKRRMKGWSKQDYQQVQEEGDRIFTAIKNNIDKGYASPEVQNQIKALQEWLNHFYTCDRETLLGLGHLYNEHPDFVKMWKTRYHADMPELLLKAIEYYCKNEKP